MSSNEPVKSSMTEKVLSELRTAINNGTLIPGQFLTEKEISEKYNVSKTPAREALGILCQEEILNKMSRKGYIVKAFSLEEVINLIRFREGLEMGIIRLAIKFATDEELDELCALADWSIDPEDPEFSRRYSAYNLDFHMFIARLSKNPYLISAFENTMIKLRSSLVSGGQRHTASDLQVHVDLAAAMKRRDVEEACRIESDDLENSIARM